MGDHISSCSLNKIYKNPDGAEVLRYPKHSKMQDNTSASKVLFVPQVLVLGPLWLPSTSLSSKGSLQINTVRKVVAPLVCLRKGWISGLIAFTQKWEARTANI